MFILDASIINIQASDYKTYLQINTMSVHYTIMSWPQRLQKTFQQYNILLNFTDFILLPQYFSLYYLFRMELQHILLTWVL